MNFKVSQAIEVLTRTPSVLTGMLGGLSDEWVHSNYGPKTFSPYDVVGHLIHGERTDWIPRLRIILEQGERRPFDPFDRYAMYRDSQGKSMGELLTEFATLRESNIRILTGLELSADQLELRGLHPELGSVVVRQLLATWVVHDLNHTHQIAKSMAYQYREEVGPWRAYVPFLSVD